jgi:polysaccharide biosynthesis protein PslH
MENNGNSSRILYVTSMLPTPPDVGVRQRIFHVGRLLQRLGSVTLALVSRFEVQDSSLNDSRKYFDNVEVFRADWHAGKKINDRVMRLMSSRDVRWRHGALTGAVRERFCDLAKSCDVVWFHSLTSADMTGIYRVDHSVIDLDDLNSFKFKLQRDVTPGWIAKARLWWLYTLWQRWEKDAHKRFSAICVCSKDDKARFGNRHNVFVIPNGFSLSPVGRVIPLEGEFRIGFIGTLIYHPNLDGATWFVNEVLPRVLKRFPRIKIRMIGKLPAEGKPCTHPNVDWLGFVDDVGAEMSSWSASIVPLRIGGGTRIKILEALSRQCPVVSTATGAYGLELEHGKHLLIADSAQDFADSCIRLLEDKGLRCEIAEAGRQRFVQRYTWDAIQPAVESVVMEVVGRDGA